MKLLGRELTTDEVIRFVRDFAIQTCRRKDCHDCLYIDMALTLADEVENNRRAAPENKALTCEGCKREGERDCWCRRAPKFRALPDDHYEPRRPEDAPEGSKS